MDRYNQDDQNVESMQQPRFPFGPPFGPPFRPPFRPPVTPPIAPPFVPPVTPPVAPPFRPPFTPPVAPPFRPPVTPPTAPPTTPPPAFIPSQPPTLFFVDPGAIRPCLFRFTFIWLTTGQAFWTFLVFVGPTSVSGFRWTGFNWVFFGTDLRNISTFVCF